MSAFKDKPAMGDVIAGISVALVLIPQSIAYASLAGLPPILGIYASILPPIIAAFFVSSPYLQTGPVAMTCLLTFGALASLATPMSMEYIGLAALLALLVGLIRVVIGFSRSGFIAYLMSQPVIAGFTAAAAVLIIATQIPTFVGVEASDKGIVRAALNALMHPQSWSPSALALGVTSILIISFGRKIHALFPGVLIAVLLGLGYSHFADYDRAVIGLLPSGFPHLSIELPWGKFRELIVPAIVIALVGFAEPAAIARSMATQNRQTWSVNKDFVSQGMANVAAGLSGCFPVGGSFSRTMINFKAGGQTRWSGAITGLSVLAFLPFVSSLAPLPRTVLAAIVISAVISLIDVRALYRILLTSPAQGSVGWITFGLTLFLTPRVDIAVLIGVGLSVAVHLWREKRIDVGIDYAGHTLRLSPVGVLYFGSAPELGEVLVQNLADHPDATKLVLDLRTVGRIDYTGALILQQVADDAEKSGLEVKIIPGGPLQGVRLLNRVLGKDSPWLLNDTSPDGPNKN
ncbi:MAG: STAS domain-containing protein [Gammaproteobacteria bacterium]|nr:STAS domain-containing protein [Gammaproteobacteria bacterium]